MKKQIDDIKWARTCLYVMLGAVVLVFTWLTVKYVLLLAFESDGWVAYGKEKKCYIDTVYGERGSIYDCQGRLVQATFPYYTVKMDLNVQYLKLKYTPPKDKAANYHDTISNYEAYADSVCVAVSDCFGQHSHAELRQMMDEAFRKHNGHFKIVEGRINHKQLMALKSMPLLRKHKNHSGLLVKTYENRENLYDSLAWRVVGAVFGDRTNKTGRYGRFGIEDYFDKELTGEFGIVEHRADSFARPIKSPVDGLDVVMTLDMDIQDKSESLLRKSFEKSHGNVACMIVMEVETGEIKAMVNFTKDSVGKVVQGQNYCIAYRAQPGSTIKPVALLAMLEDGTCDINKKYLVNNGNMIIPGTDKPITDTHHDSLYLTPKGIIAYSSNCGMARIALDGYVNNPKGDWTKFYDAMIKMGFTHKIGIELNTEAMPIVYNPADKYDKKEYLGWSRTTMPSMAFGYELMMTPLYTLNFYNAVANGGYYVRPHIVRELRRGGEVVRDFSAKPSRRPMAHKENIKFLQDCLLEVVERPGGTGYDHIRNDFVRIAGKTGTARMNGTDADGNQRYMVTFVGYFPAEKPKYTALVMMAGNYYSEGAPSRCGSVVRDIAKHLMINY